MFPENLKFQSLAGTICFTSLEDFVENHIPVQKIQRDIVHTASLKSPNLLDIASTSPEEQGYSERKTIITKPVKLDEQKLDLRYFKEAQRECLIEFKKNQLIPILLKKWPDFTVKDLSSSIIEDLATKYAQNFGNRNTIIAFPIILSKYQQYLIVANPDAFKFYWYESYLTRSPQKNDSSIVIKLELGKGALEEIYPNNWVLGRFDDAKKFYEELSKATRK